VKAGWIDDRGQQTPARPAKRPPTPVLVKISTGIGGTTAATAVFSSRSVFHGENLLRAGAYMRAGSVGPAATPSRQSATLGPQQSTTNIDRRIESPAI